MSTHVTKVWWDGEKLMVEPIPESEIYKEPAQQEPVAGQCRFPGVAWSQCDPAHVRMVLDNPHEWKGYEVRYLYDHPPAQRKPLTHEQRLEVLTRFKKYDMEWHGPAILIDLVEAAHGIKKDAA